MGLLTSSGDLFFRPPTARISESSFVSSCPLSKASLVLFKLSTASFRFSVAWISWALAASFTSLASSDSSPSWVKIFCCSSKLSSRLDLSCLSCSRISRVVVVLVVVVVVVLVVVVGQGLASQTSASISSTVVQLTKSPLTTSLLRWTVPTPQETEQLLHKVHSVGTSWHGGGGQASKLQVPVSEVTSNVQELPTPRTNLRVLRYFPPPQEELHELHSLQSVPMCLQTPEGGFQQVSIPIAKVSSLKIPLQMLFPPPTAS